MNNKLLKMIDELFPLKEKEAGEFSNIDMGFMSFKVNCYQAQGLGHVCLMQANSVNAVMQMDSLIINPLERDMALISYDRIKAMGKDTLIFEIEKTMLGDASNINNSLNEVLNKYNDLENVEDKDDWCASMRYEASIKKVVAEKDAKRLDQLEMEYLTVVLSLAQQVEICDIEQKRMIASAYSDGLLQHGGLSTDQFIKVKGKEYTKRFFKEVFFGC